MTQTIVALYSVALHTQIESSYVRVRDVMERGNCEVQRINQEIKNTNLLEEKRD